MVKAILFVLFFFMSYQQNDLSTAFTVYTDDPVVSHSTTRGDWDDRYTDPGAVIYHDGKFHMFRNGFQAWPAYVSIGYLTSDDGFVWAEVTEEPVLSTGDVPYAETAALASDVIVADDGTWVMYFYTWGIPGRKPSAFSIGRATASDPLGPWIVEDAPVLTQGEDGSWDSAGVSAPRVVKTDNGYAMYYTGHGGSTGTERIGMAFSEDGVVWTKHEEPILTPEEGYSFVHQPMVQKTPDGWAMIYRKVVRAGHMELGYATSEDGINWTPVGTLWGRSDIPRSTGFWYTAFVYHDDTYYLYIEAGRGRNTDIYVVTAQNCDGVPCTE